MTCSESEAQPRKRIFTLILITLLVLVITVAVFSLATIKKSGEIKSRVQQDGLNAFLISWEAFLSTEDIIGKLGLIASVIAAAGVILYLLIKSKFKLPEIE